MRLMDGSINSFNDINDILNQIDRYFDDNKPKEAEKFMLECLTKADENNDDAMSLQLLNELIGYYRQTSEKEKLLEVVERSMQLADAMKLNGSVSYATTLLNCANALRSIGQLDTSLGLYEKTEEIYAKELAADDMRLAGFYNNFALLCQELGDFKRAEECLIAALDIAVKNDAGFEVAVTYANLANTQILAGNYEKAEEYAVCSIDLFYRRNYFDAHFASAVSALGMCLFKEGRFEAARDKFLMAMDVVKNTIGKNSQYERLKESYEKCLEKIDTDSEISSEKFNEEGLENDETEKRLSGMELSRGYFETYGRPMLEEKFPEYINCLCAGLAGEGSDCYGFDDEQSMDHDAGPAFCIWLDDDVYEEIGARMSEAYDELPDEYMGYKRTVSSQGMGRRGVMSVSQFLSRLMQTEVSSAIFEQESSDELTETLGNTARNNDALMQLFITVPDYGLAAAVNGEIFYGNGSFRKIRERLKKGYPQKIRLLKMAQEAALFSQTGQYNYERMLKRGDTLTAFRMISDYMGHAMRLWHYFNNVYPPHDKWLFRSTQELPEGEFLSIKLKRLQRAVMEEGIGAKATDAKMADAKIAEAVIEEIAEFFAEAFYENNDISDVDTYLEHHCDELMFRASMSMLSKEELVDRIVKLEFTAFDKVKNEGGRASCQNDWPTFSIMRKSQYLTWDTTMLRQYYYDFSREFSQGHNLITEKYGRMMESTSPDRYSYLAQHFPVIDETKKAIIEQIVALQMTMAEAFAAEHGRVASNARLLHTYEDDIWNTSYETYLRGEISTYSDRMLQLYGQYVVRHASEGKNIAQETITNTAILYGYKDLESFEKQINEWG